MAKIVVADDDADIRELVAFKLVQSGHDVVAVGDGSAALDACRRDAPDLVLLDVMMPGAGGLEVCRELRSDPALLDVRVLLLTAKAQESDLEKGLRAGADDYMVKPFSPRELASRVAAALERPRG